MKWTSEHLNGVAVTICNNNDFNANVLESRSKCREIIADYAADYGLSYNPVSDSRLTSEIVGRANIEWRNRQKQAGVNPKYWRV